MGIGSFAEGMGGGFLEGLLEGRHEAYERDRTQAEEAYKQGSQRLQDIVTSMESDPNTPYNTKYLLDVMAEQQKLQKGPTKSRFSLKHSTPPPQLAFLKQVMDGEAGLDPENPDANVQAAAQAQALFPGTEIPDDQGKGKDTPLFQGTGGPEELANMAGGGGGVAPTVVPPMNTLLEGEPGGPPPPILEAPVLPTNAENNLSLAVTGGTEALANQAQAQAQAQNVDYGQVAATLRANMPDPWSPGDDFLLTQADKDKRSLIQNAQQASWRLAAEMDSAQAMFDQGMSADQIHSALGWPQSPERASLFGDPNQYMIYSSPGQDNVIAAVTTGGQLRNVNTNQPFDSSGWTFEETLAGRTDREVANTNADAARARMAGQGQRIIPSDDGRGYFLVNDQTGASRYVALDPETPSFGGANVGSFPPDPVAKGLEEIIAHYGKLIQLGSVQDLSGMGDPLETVASAAGLGGTVLNDPDTGVRASLGGSPVGQAMLNRINIAAGGPSQPLTMTILHMAAVQLRNEGAEPLPDGYTITPQDLLPSGEQHRANIEAVNNDPFFSKAERRTARPPVNVIEDLLASDGVAGRAARQVIRSMNQESDGAFPVNPTAGQLNAIFSGQEDWTAFYDRVKMTAENSWGLPSPLGLSLGASE